jgi:hypothetical protein
MEIFGKLWGELVAFVVRFFGGAISRKPRSAAHCRFVAGGGSERLQAEGHAIGFAEIAGGDVPCPRLGAAEQDPGGKQGQGKHKLVVMITHGLFHQPLPYPAQENGKRAAQQVGNV